MNQANSNDKTTIPAEMSVIKFECGSSPIHVVIQPESLNGFIETKNQPDATARRINGILMIQGDSVTGRFDLLSCPKKTNQIILNVYRTVIAVTANAEIKINQRQENESPDQSQTFVRIESFERNPEKNGIPARDAPATTKTKNVVGNFFRSPPRLRMS